MYFQLYKPSVFNSFMLLHTLVVDTVYILTGHPRTSVRGSVEYCHVNRIFMCDQLCPGQSHYHQSLTPWSPGQHSDQPGFAGSGKIKYRKLEYKNTRLTLRFAR